MATRNSAISLRLSDGEKAKLRVVAERLDVRETDVLRYAIELTLSRLGPLLDPGVSGVDLLPVFVETGSEMLRYFSLDSQRLDMIVNAGIDEPAKRVDSRDLALLASSYRDDPVAAVHLRALFANADDSVEQGLEELQQRFRDYLYRKYLYDRDNSRSAHNGAELKRRRRTE